MGRKGDGPHDFKHLPFVFVRPESLVCTDFTKIIWFSKKGEVLKTMPFSALKDFDLSSEMLLVPAGDRFLRITADHAQLKRRVYLVDSTFTTIEMLELGRRRSAFVYRLTRVSALLMRVPAPRVLTPELTSVDEVRPGSRRLKPASSASTSPGWMGVRAMFTTSLTAIYKL